LAPKNTPFPKNATQRLRNAAGDFRFFLKGTRMTVKRILSDPDRERAAHVVALFSVLIHAWQTNDFKEAATARDELQAMGVIVRLPRRLRSDKGVTDAK
jgi:hypothetical protein